METQIKIKPWGREIWFAHNDKYAGKILELTKGHRFSLQFHEIKEETQYLYSGKVRFTYGTDKDNLTDIILEPGDKLDITPGMIHRAEALDTGEGAADGDDGQGGAQRARSAARASASSG